MTGPDDEDEWPDTDEYDLDDYLNEADDFRNPYDDEWDCYDDLCFGDEYVPEPIKDGKYAALCKRRRKADKRAHIRWRRYKDHERRQHGRDTFVVPF